MPEESTEYTDPNFAYRALLKISDETGVSIYMINQIRDSITKERKTGVHITSKNVCEFLILDLVTNDNGSIKDMLIGHGINSSEDVGTVIRKLCEEKLLIKEEHDNYEDFNGRFTAEFINDFIKLKNLKKEKDMYKMVNDIMYLSGGIIVVVSYITSIPNQIAYMGWVLILAGWLLFTFKKRVKELLIKKKV